MASDEEREAPPVGATSESEDEHGLGEEELGEATEEELLARLPAGCTVRRTARQPGSGETAAEELELLRARLCVG